MNPIKKLCLLGAMFVTLTGTAQIVPVGVGSYTKTFPGTDVAGRNGFPSGVPQVVGNAAGRPVPTNDWWSSLIKENHASNLFNYPFTLKTTAQGLVVSYIPAGVIDDVDPLLIGVEGLNAPKVSVSDYSDWTVSMDWSDANASFNVTAGIGMPFLYITQSAAKSAKVSAFLGTVTVENEMMVIERAKNGASFAVYAPKGSIWTQEGKVFTSTLSGKGYWSVAMLPSGASDLMATARNYKKYAYVFPTTTQANYSYNESNSTLTTHYITQVDVKEGTDDRILQGLLPHQWSKITAPMNYLYQYPSIRGALKTIAANQFSTSVKFSGILPTLPYVNYYSNGFDPSKLTDKIEAIQYDGLATWTDSYNEGQVMNRLIQTARIAHEMGNIAARDQMLATIRTRLENWLTASSGEKVFLFYYNSTWSALLGYPAGHGQDTNLNDHHFHWGYFIHAAAFLEQFQPGWAADWGAMIDLLVRDAASVDRNDAMFPYLRNFSPFAGHCWANGFATFPNGNDQESTSESMQFNSSLIHWGEISGNKAIRDLGIYLYTTEQAAIEEYWFDQSKRNFRENYPYGLVSRVWGNSYDNGTFWTADIAASYGIEMYPIHAGSLYLGHNKAYATRLWDEIGKNTGILRNEANVNLWHDVYWQYLSFIDPQKAIELYDSYPDRELKFGVSDAQTYQWIHAMNVLGEVDASVTADYPIAAAFKKEDNYTYVVHNYSNAPRMVTFSTGYQMTVPPRRMATNRSSALIGTISTPFSEVFAGGSVTLNLSIEGGNADRIEWFDGNTKVGESTDPLIPFVVNSLSPARHTFYARLIEGDRMSLSNQIVVTVGRQLPYNGNVLALPGSIEAGAFDEYEGGIGQGISYMETTSNSGNARLNERVDVVNHATEGLTVHSIAAGEWLEYTVDIASSGLYNLALRYASNNSSGGGPFDILLDDRPIAQSFTLSKTAGWETYATKTVPNVPLIAGVHTLKLLFKAGEFNLGRMTFTRTSDLPYSQPLARLDKVRKVVLPNRTVTLDGTQSIDPSGGNLTYRWEQVYGPSVVDLGDKSRAVIDLDGLFEGVYKVELTVTNGAGKSDRQEQLIVVTAQSTIAPSVGIVVPANGHKVIEQTFIELAASASDLDGEVSSVEFFNNGTSIGVAHTRPFKISWVVPLGMQSITAKATDNDGQTAMSVPIVIEGTVAPGCAGQNVSGDYGYQFSESNANPTLTFIPNNTSVGASTLILYYGTGAGPYPGYNVKPNTPFQLNAAAGSTINFYYTYSTPTGEKNTMNAKDTYVIGSCRNTSITQVKTSRSIYYPNPVVDHLYLCFSAPVFEIAVADYQGQVLKRIETLRSTSYTLPMSTYESGIYFIILRYENSSEVIKVVKK